MSMKSQCECGATQTVAHKGPIIRAYCHCQNCQAFNNVPYADVAVFRAADVDIPADELVAYEKFPSPLVEVPRGKCRNCGKPAVEKMHITGLPNMVLVPTGNFEDPSALPEPVCHIFYHRRVADISDDLPKYSGFLNSQLQFSRRLLGSLLRHRG